MVKLVGMIILFIPNLFIGLMLTGCALVNSGVEKFSTPEPTKGIEDQIPLFPSGKRIYVNSTDSANLLPIF